MKFPQNSFLILFIFTVIVFFYNVFFADAWEQFGDSIGLSYQNSKLNEKYDCKVCHSDGEKNLNPFGKDMERVIKTEKISANVGMLAIKWIELLDSDLDGYTNIEELSLSTNPGDKDDFPSEALFSGVFRFTGPISEPRYLHAVTTLEDGRVLVSGGLSKRYKPLPSCELFDPQKNKFVKTGSMKYTRYLHTSILLKDGKILIVGGVGGKGSEKKLIKEVELYNPETGEFSLAGFLNIPRQGHTATLLSDGRVLIVGGGKEANYLKAKGVSKLEVYDSKKGKFEIAGELEIPRQFHTATLLNDGRVLVTGGSQEGLKATLSSTEVYDPKTNKIYSISPMNNKRIGHAAVLLNDGTVLIIGGSDYVSIPRIKTAEVFDPKSNKFTPTDSLNIPRVDMEAILLDDGNVLIAGGSMKGPVFHSSAEVYDYKTKRFNFTGSMSVGRDTFSAVKLTDGRVLFVGGATKEGNRPGFKFLTIAEVYRKKINNNQKPDVNVSIDKTEGKAPLKISFNAKVRDGIECFWDFGDDCTGEGEKVEHIYLCPGDYKVTALAIDEKGNNTIKSFNIKATPAARNYVSFNCNIEPILDNRCRICHGFFGDSVVDSYKELVSSSLVLPENPKESRLRMINEIKKEILPGFNSLPLEELKLIMDWIDQGAREN